jgi:hypothetical protein
VGWGGVGWDFFNALPFAPKFRQTPHKLKNFVKVLAGSYGNVFPVIS